MRYERNNDPNYYIEKQHYSNCGSFALNLKGWYDPEEYFYDIYGPIDFWMESLREDYTNEELSDMYADVLVEGMLEEFKGELRLLECIDDEIDDDEELISFRGVCDNDIDEYDFHFKVFRNGRWMEKHGGGPVRECREWDWGWYISETYYFAHRKVV